MLEAEVDVSRPLNDSDMPRELTGLANAFIGVAMAPARWNHTPSQLEAKHSPRAQRVNFVFLLIQIS